VNIKLYNVILEYNIDERTEISTILRNGSRRDRWRDESMSSIRQIFI